MWYNSRMATWRRGSKGNKAATFSTKPADAMADCCAASKDRLYKSFSTAVSSSSLLTGTSRARAGTALSFANERIFSSKRDSFLGGAEAAGGVGWC